MEKPRVWDQRPGAGTGADLTCEDPLSTPPPGFEADDTDLPELLGQRTEKNSALERPSSRSRARGGPGNCRGVAGGIAAGERVEAGGPAALGYVLA